HDRGRSGLLAVEPEHKLGQVVGADAQEIGRLSDGAGAKRSFRRLDHGSELWSRPPIKNAVERLANGRELRGARHHRNEDSQVGPRTGLDDRGELRRQSARRSASPRARSTRSGSGRRTTSPRSPSTTTSSPSWISRSSGPAPTTIGRPSERATIAA